MKQHAIKSWLSSDAWRRRAAVLTGIALLGSLPLLAKAALLSGAPTALSVNNVAQGGLLGWSVAVSANGKVAAGGAPATNRSGTGGTDYTGAAYVWTQTSGTWSDPITLSTSGIATGGQIGVGIAVSSDGQEVLVGAPDLSTFTGAVYVYTEANGSWTNTPTRTALSLPSGVTTDYSFGAALAVSSDGTTLVVGAPHSASTGSSPGGLYVYTMSNGTWSNPMALSMGSIANSSEIGQNVAVSANGTVILAGAGNSKSAAYVWTKSGGSWSGPVALSVPASADGAFGNSVALSGAGTVALIGDYTANNGAGVAYVYSYAGSWSTTPASLSTSDSNTGSFGYSVAISPDGTNAYLGAFNNSSTGLVYLSTHSSGNWSSPLTLSASNVPPGSDIGTDLVQGDYGEELVTSGEVANLNTGGLWVYTSPAAITLAAASSAPMVAPGSNLTFNFTFTNTDQPGSTPATTLNSVVLTDTLPQGVSYVSSNAANGSCSHNGNTVTCTLSSLAPGNNSQNPWTPSITVTTPATAANLSNTLAASADEPLVGSASVTTQITSDVVPTVKSGSVSTSTNKSISGTLSATPGYPGQILTFSIVSQPSGGTVTLTNTSTGSFTYTPNSGYTGTDTFVWTAGDGLVNAAPVAESVNVGSGGGSSGGSGSSGGGGGAFDIVSIALLLLLAIKPKFRKAAP